MPNPLADEARTMTDAELGDAVNEAYREIFNLQFQKGTRQLQNPMAMRSARRQIARLRTILRERQLAAAAGTPIEPLAPVVVDPEPEDPPDAPAAEVDQLSEAGGTADGDETAAELDDPAEANTDASDDDAEHEKD